MKSLDGEDVKKEAKKNSKKIVMSNRINITRQINEQLDFK